MSYTLSRHERLATPTNLAFKSPKRISITLPHNAYEYLLKRSDDEGRSLSNLAAYLLERAFEEQIGVGIDNR